MCFETCYPLQSLLKLSGVTTVMMQGVYENASVNHVWLQCEDGTIIDPTADQFGGPKVYVGPAAAASDGWPITTLYVNGSPW